MSDLDDIDKKTVWVKIPAELIFNVVDYHYESLIENSSDGRELCKAIKVIDNYVNS